MVSLSIRQTLDKGTAVYAAQHIPAGTRILKFVGPTMRAADIPRPLRPEDDHYLQIDVDLFLGPSEEVDNLVNHSCDPNALVEFTEFEVFLVSMRDIAEGEEVSFDYSTTSTDTPALWQLQCCCESPHCRGQISGFQTVPENVQRYYVSKGAVPSYVLGRS